MPATTPPSEDAREPTGDARTRLMQAALAIVCEQGLAGASARTIAARAGAAQGLVFYHFHTVSELLEAASNHAVDHSVERYREAFADVTTLGGLLGVGRELHEHERRTGNVAFMAQMMSGAQHDPVLARAARYAMSAWTHEVSTVLDRALHDRPVADLVDVDGLAHLISAGFIGLELYDGVDEAGATDALATLDALGQLVDVLDDLGPIARRALRRRTTRHDS